jgi:hypothetical protein
LDWIGLVRRFNARSAREALSASSWGWLCQGGKVPMYVFTRFFIERNRDDNVDIDIHSLVMDAKDSLGLENCSLEIL